MKKLIAVVSLIVLAALGVDTPARECGGNGKGKQKGQANGCVNQCVPPGPDCTFVECAQCACNYVCSPPGSTEPFSVVVPFGSASFLTGDPWDDVFVEPSAPNTVDVKVQPPEVERVRARRVLPER